MSDPRTGTLDPEDWEAFRRLAHRMVDDMLDHLSHRREQKVWTPMPAEARAALQGPLPDAPVGEQKVYEEFLAHIFPYLFGNTHPRFWAWIVGTGAPLGAMADLLAAVMNPSVGGCDHSANDVEAQVLDWCKQLLGYPADASGVLVSGGSMANLLGLAVARDARAGYDFRAEGVRGADRPFTFYASSEVHSSVTKAVELLGFGSAALRRVPAGPAGTLDPERLSRALDEDEAAGLRPLCVVATAGTTNTGAIDPIAALAELTRRRGLWLHVDGALAALGRLSPRLEPLLAGMEQADSLAFDLHKWACVPYDIGCVLVKDARAHRDAFALTPAYLATATRGIATGSLWLRDHGIELSRGFRALKAWMMLKAYGVDTYRRLVEDSLDFAQQLKATVTASPELELCAPVATTVVCFRYVDRRLAPEALNALNGELLLRLQERGVVAPSGTVVEGKACLRVCFSNQRTRAEDVDLLVAEVLATARELAPSWPTALEGGRRA